MTSQTENAEEKIAGLSEGSSGGGKWVVIVLALAAVGGGIWWKMHDASKGGAAGGAQSPAAAALAEKNRPVPVKLTKVQRSDVPIYLEGLGSVTPLKTVTVKTLVDGRLDSVGFKEGQTVHRGDLLAQIDPRPFQIMLQTAQANLAKDKAQARNSKLDLDRYTELRKGSLVPQQQVDGQQTTVDQAIASVQADDAQINNARLQLDYARITSPIDGVTGVRLVDPGNVVHAVDPGGIVLITQLDPIAVLFTLPEDDFIQVAKELRTKGTVTTEAWNRDGTEKLSVGQLALIDNQINQATATIRLKAIFGNPEKTLWPNQFVKARLLIETRKDALTVPAEVVQRGPKGTFVYVVTDETAKARDVTVESTQGNVAIISEGLAAGETVVRDGQAQLRDGSKISARVGDTAPTAPSAAAAGSSPAGDAAAPSNGQGGHGVHPSKDGGGR